MNKIEIVVGDKKYNVKTNESPEYVKKIETILNDQIDIIANQNKRFNDIDRLILSSFVIIDKYIKIDNEFVEYKSEIYDEIQSLTRSVENAEKEKEETAKNLLEIDLEREKFRERLLTRDNDREYLNSQISKLQERISEQDQQLLKSEMLINELKLKNEELIETNGELSRERENFTKELSFMNNTKSSLNGRISKLQLRVNEKEHEIIKLEKNIRELKSSIDEKSQKIYTFTNDQEKKNLFIEAREKEVYSLEKKIDLLQNKLDEKDGTIKSRDKVIQDLKNSELLLKEKYESVNDDKEKYLEELLMINNDKESLINNINQLQEKLNRKESENFQNQLEINQLKKEYADLMELLDKETSK